MSIVDRIMEYKRRYDEMDPYKKEKLNISVVGAIVLIVALYLIANSIQVIRNFLS